MITFSHKEQSPTGAWFGWVEIDGTGQPFKFFQEPTEAEVLREAQAWVNARQVQAVEEKVTARIIRDWQFRERFTPEQLIGVMRAAMAGDNLAALVWLQLSTASDGIDLDNPSNVAGVHYVAQAYPQLGIDPVKVLA